MSFYSHIESQPPRALGTHPQTEELARSGVEVAGGATSSQVFGMNGSVSEVRPQSEYDDLVGKSSDSPRHSEEYNIHPLKDSE